MIDTGNDGFDRPKHKPKPEAEAGLAEPTGSPTWPFVLEFAKRMEAKLEKNRHKGDREGWLKDTPDALWDRLSDEALELYESLSSGDCEHVADEAADVANFAMMVSDAFRERAKSGNTKLTDAGGRERPN